MGESFWDKWHHRFMSAWDVLTGRAWAGYQAPDIMGDVRARAALIQIATVCTDNMDRSCDHRMALDFVRQVANAELE